MMISDEQVRRAVEYLQTTEEYAWGTERLSEPPSRELIERVVEALGYLPEICDDRVQRGRALMAGDLPPSSDLASKLIGRVISDTIR